MTGAWAVLKKDFASHHRSWTGVLVLFAFLLISGIFFTLFVLGYSQLSLEASREAFQNVEGVSLTAFILGAFYLNMGVLLLFLAPLLTMRSLAEEKRTGTLELLFTYPLSDFEIVLGKYLALVAGFTVLFLPTLAYVGVLLWLKASLDGGILAASSTGFLLLGASFLAAGLFFSALTENQILAAGLTFAFLLLFWVSEWLIGFLPGPWDQSLAALTPFVHFRDFSLGVVDFSDLTYFFCFIAFFLFLTLRVVESRNWKV